MAIQDSEQGRWWAMEDLQRATAAWLRRSNGAFDLQMVASRRRQLSRGGGRRSGLRPVFRWLTLIWLGPNRIPTGALSDFAITFVAECMPCAHPPRGAA